MSDSISAVIPRPLEFEASDGKTYRLALIDNNALVDTERFLARRAAKEFLEVAKDGGLSQEAISSHLLLLDRKPIGIETVIDSLGSPSIMRFLIWKSIQRNHADVKQDNVFALFVDDEQMSRVFGDLLTASGYTKEEADAPPNPTDAESE